MRLDIVNGDVVTGDGKTYSEGTSVFTEDGLITEVPSQRYPPYRFFTDEVIDADGGIIMPGLINTHVHAVSLGPTLVWAWKPLPLARIIGNLDTHLRQGTTTALDLDGFTLPFENEATNKLHPLNLKLATLHTPKSVIAAETESRTRIEEVHRSFTAEEAAAQGAIAMGEVGSPSTSYGTYEKNLQLGHQAIDARLGQALDDAYMEGDEDAFLEAMKQAGLEEMGVEAAKKLTYETSVECIEAANEAILETIEYAPRLGIPAFCHTEPPSYDAVREVAKEIGPQLLALHMNHHCTPDEAVAMATDVRAHGGYVEIFTADSLGAKQIEPDETIGHALLENGLVDTICTTIRVAITIRCPSISSASSSWASSRFPRSSNLGDELARDQDPWPGAEQGPDRTRKDRGSHHRREERHQQSPVCDHRREGPWWRMAGSSATDDHGRLTCLNLLRESR